MISEGFVFRSHPSFTIPGSAFELHCRAAPCCMLCYTHLGGSEEKNNRSLHFSKYGAEGKEQELKLQKAPEN